MRRLALAVAAALVLAPAAAQALDVAATAPTQTVRVGKQRIGYRSFGSGRPVVFIQGLAGTIDGWPPSFLDSVAAAHHRVVIFDNEGVGRSTLRKGTLSIRRMAQDTARLIGALRLKRPDVVGWSMGGMTAQSFAVNYPRRLRRLVLMATAPGDGKATLPDAAALQELASGDAAKLLARLFPPDQTAARDRYVSDILRRLDFNGIAPPAVVTAQLGASAKWITGGDPDGARVARLKARTLVGGGELDELLPVANQRHLAALIPHAKLITYPDAAHGFFFQHDADFVPRLVGFLR
jgi:pimeloyl-ACP methyl ester carboxylesterase